MAKLTGIEWTNASVLRLANGQDPIAVVERKVRELVLRARDEGWQGPPFNPVAIADMLKIPLQANADVSDALTTEAGGTLAIQFNPTQPRERVRFSIAHEIAHTLFPDVGEKVRHRAMPTSGDDWQLEMLCNLAAAEFVMPIGSLPGRDELPPIEDLMIERKRFDVSAEAFLIRVTKVAREPVILFCASPLSGDGINLQYRINYSVASSSAPSLSLNGRLVPKASCVYSCTAIGYTDKKKETWFSQTGLVESVGIPADPGSSLPRVAGLVRFKSDSGRDTIKFVNGNVLEPRGAGNKIICQLVNDQARTWGGGLAKQAAKQFPDAQHAFSDWITSIPRAKRLGEVHFAQVSNSVFLASLVAQHGFGQSLFPRIRYAAVEQGFERISELAASISASVHLPRIGAGAAGGSWDMIEEIIRDALVDNQIPVVVYSLPPKREQAPGLFD